MYNAKTNEIPSLWFLKMERNQRNLYTFRTRRILVPIFKCKKKNVYFLKTKKKKK